MQQVSRPSTILCGSVHHTAAGTRHPQHVEQCVISSETRKARLLQRVAAKVCRSNARFVITRNCTASDTVQADYISLPCTASDNVRVGPTPFGRGLLTSRDLSTDERLLSVPFDQLLLLPPSQVNLSTNKFYSKYFKKHGVLPDQLLKFITQGHLPQPLLKRLLHTLQTVGGLNAARQPLPNLQEVTTGKCV